MREYNFDGLVGPTHQYAGLSFGNLASTEIEAFVLEHDLGEDEAELLQRELEAHGIEIQHPEGAEAPEKETEKPKLKIEFQKGDAVKIKEGPFENYDGVIDEVDQKNGRLRNAAFARSAASSSPRTEDSNSLTRAAIGRSRFSSRSFCVPMTLARSVLIMRGSSDPARHAAHSRATRHRWIRTILGHGPREGKTPRGARRAYGRASSRNGLMGWPFRRIS